MESYHHSKARAKHLLVIFSCMLIQMFPFGMTSEVPPLYVNPLNETFHFSMAHIGFIFTIGSIASSIASPFIGKLFDHYSTKLLMIIGVAISSIGLFINGFATQLWQFYLANAIVQIGVITYSSLGIPYLIGKWFNKEEKAAAMGFAFAGGAIGNFFWQPVFSYLLNTYSIHKVYLLSAAIAFISGLMIILLLVRNKRATVKSNQVTTQTLVLHGIGFTKTRKLPLFWMLAFSMFFLGINIAAQSSQYANFFSSIHLEAATIGLIGSTFAVSALGGNILGGLLISKFGLLNGARVAAILQILSAISMLILSVKSIAALGFSWAILYGLSGFIYMSGPAVMVQYLFGMKESSQILGWINIFFAIGFALGSVLFGMFVDLFNFQMAWIFILVCLFICYAMMLTSIHRIEKHHYAEQ